MDGCNVGGELDQPFPWFLIFLGRCLVFWTNFETNSFMSVKGRPT